jgi:hypothetical protein
VTILSKRTKLLLCGAALLPASVILARISINEATYEAWDEGALAAWIDLGPPYYMAFLLGLLSLVCAAVSLVLDIRRSRDQGQC